MEKVIVNNPVMDYNLAKFRDKNTSTYECNIAVENLSFFLAGEISRFLQTEEKNIVTPLGEMLCQVIEEEIGLVPVLRAGVSMLGGFQRMLPQSKVGFVWAHRNEEALPIIDKAKFPKTIDGNVEISGKTVVILDTMLATAGTINATADLVMQYKPKQVLCASVLSTPLGISNLSANITALVTVSEADGLDDRAYICPGVGDSGDRLYG